MDDIVWIKLPGSRCTTKCKLRQVTGVVNHHSVEVNGVLCHKKHLRPFWGPIPRSKSETDSKNQSVECGIPITLGPTLLDDTADTTRPEVDDSLTDPSLSENDIPIVLLRRSTWQKRPTQSCMVCNSVNQLAENEILTAFGPAPLDDTLNATRLNADDPLTEESSSKSDAPATLLRRSTWQKKLAPSCTVFNQNKVAQMSVEALPLDTKECMPMLPSHCAKRANSVHINIVPKRPRHSCDLKIRVTYVHLGSKASSFERWVDNRLSCLKYTGNLTHFSCKCPAGKRYKT